LFDLNRDPRPVALSYRELLRMHKNEAIIDPGVVDLLADAQKTRAVA
jgi:hypothetical protein